MPSKDPPFFPHLPLEQDTSPPFNSNTKHMDIWISPKRTEDHEYPEVELPSYFETCVSNQHKVTNSNTIPLKTQDESNSPSQFRIYDHPVWPNWSGIWNLDTYELDPDLFPPPILEENCHGVQFRLQPVFSNAIFGIPPICQGTSFVFKGFEDPSIRYIIEWCQWTDNKYAYLKVVGTRISGNPYPYNHIQHPTFILVVPLNLSLTPFPPLMIECQHRNPVKKKIRNTSTSADA